MNETLAATMAPGQKLQWLQKLAGCRELASSGCFLQDSLNRYFRPRAVTADTDQHGHCHESDQNDADPRGIGDNDDIEEEDDGHHCYDDHDHREHSDGQYENGEHGQC